MPSFSKLKEILISFLVTVFLIIYMPFIIVYRKRIKPAVIICWIVGIILIIDGINNLYVIERILGYGFLYEGFQFIVVIIFGFIGLYGFGSLIHAFDEERDKYS